MTSLDLFSTRHTKRFPDCRNNAPYLCIPPKNGTQGRILQLCCNDWNCERCGEMRARYEYGRIVEGIRTLETQGHDLYFLTITCTGTITVEEAEKTYYAATTKFLNAYRNRVRRRELFWCYAAVTERQKRNHPHSHMIITAVAHDAFNRHADYPRYLKEIEKVNTQIPYEMAFRPLRRAEMQENSLHSTWTMLQAVRSGLGVQLTLSEINEPEGASRYMAKYLFKQAMYERWPKGWRRIRYSRNFPKLPEGKNHDAYVLHTGYDWFLANKEVGLYIVLSENVLQHAKAHGIQHVRLFAASSELRLSTL